MAKKKAVKKTTRKVSKKETKRRKKPSRVVMARSSSENNRFHQILEPRRSSRESMDSSKIKVVFNNLLLFALIFGLSVFFYKFLQDLFFKNIFLLLAILSGFVGLAFVIVLLIFLFLRLLRK